MVTIPYVKGLSEAFSWILKTYRICTAVRPHTTLRSMLVHPKDKISDEEKPEVVYKIPCKNCERIVCVNLMKLFIEYLAKFSQK